MSIYHSFCKQHLKFNTMQMFWVRNLVLLSWSLTRIYFENSEESLHTQIRLLRLPLMHLIPCSPTPCTVGGELWRLNNGGRVPVSSQPGHRHEENGTFWLQLVHRWPHWTVAGTLSARRPEGAPFSHAVITLGRLKNLRFPTQRCLVSCADLWHYLQMGAGFQGASHRQVGKHQDCPPHLQEQVASKHQVQQFSVEVMLIGIKEFVSYSAYWGSLKVTAGWDTPWMPSGHTLHKSFCKAWVCVLCSKFEKKGRMQNKT